MDKRGFAVIMASFLTVLIGFTVRTSYSVLLPEMLPSLRISKAESGVIYGSFFMAYTIFSLVLGLLSDRISIRLLLTLFLGVLGVGTFLMGYASSLTGAIFFFLLAGIGSSVCWSPVVALVQRWMSDKRRGLTLGFVDVGGSIGIAVSSFIMPLIVADYSWRIGWKGLGATALLIAVVNLFLVRDFPLDKSNYRNRKLNVRRDKPISNAYVRIMKDIRFWFMGMSYLLIGFSALVPLTFISTYAYEELMLSYSAASRLITVMAIASIAGKMALSSLSDALGRIKALVACEILVAVSNLCIVYLHGPLALNLSIAVFGFGQGAIWPLYALCGLDYFSEGSSGFIIGFWTLLLGIGMMASPILAGWIADVTGSFTQSFILAMVTAVISIFLLLAGKKVAF